MTEYVKTLDDLTYETNNKQKNLHAVQSGWYGAYFENKVSELNKPGKLESWYNEPHKIVKRLDFDAYVIDEMGKEM